jgi:hypothetical protein
MKSINTFVDKKVELALMTSNDAVTEDVRVKAMADLSRSEDDLRRAFRAFRAAGA